MKISEMVSYLAKKEAGKSEVKVADIREIVGIISDLVHQNPDVMASLLANGKKRSKKKKSK